MKNLYISLGYRNVLRNKRRSLITASVIAIGLASVVLAQGFTSGFLNYMVKSSTSDFFGQGRIHHVNFDKLNQPKFMIKDPQRILKIAEKHGSLKKAALRTMSNGMLASPEGSLNVRLVGINAYEESSFSKLSHRIKSGNYLSKNMKEREILVGSEIADRLKLEIDSKLIVTISKIGNAEISQEMFKVRGIFDFENKAMDQIYAFVHLKHAQNLLGLTNEVHEVAFNFHSMGEIVQFKEYISKHLDNHSQFKSWDEFLPSVKAIVEMSGESIGFITLFMSLLVLLAVANTLYMSLYERIFEFGVIRAIGTRPYDVKKMIFFEAFTLGVLGILLGLLIIAAFGGYMAWYGVDYTGLSYGGVTLKEPIYFEFSWSYISLCSVGLLAFVSLVSLYPARQIMKITTADALRSRG